MTAEGALFYFLSGFGIPAYADTSVPDDAGMPYLTYELAVGDWYSGEVNVPVRLWYRTTSEAVLNAKVREIARGVTAGGSTVPCEGGILWIKRGSPWAQAVADESDSEVRSRYINLDIEYLIVE